MKNVITVKELIDTINDLDEDADVAFECSFSDLLPNSLCELIYNEDSEEVTKTIPIYQIVDVIENIKQQITNPTYEEIIKSMVFYVENDAFIETE